MRRLMHGEAPAQDLGDLLALEGVAQFPVRIKCALLSWMALKDALEKNVDAIEAPTEGLAEAPADSSPEPTEEALP